MKAFDETFMNFHFKTAKIFDWKMEDLEQDSNIFAIVTMASIQSHEEDMQKRFVSKERLTKMLYERGYSKEVIFALYEFLDGIIVLSDDLEKQYNDNIKNYEKEKNMPYITTAERIGIKKGREEGRVESREEIAIEMLKEHMAVEQIVKFTKLDKEKVLELKKELTL